MVVSAFSEFSRSTIKNIKCVLLSQSVCCPVKSYWSGSGSAADDKRQRSAGKEKKQRGTGIATPWTSQTPFRTPMGKV